MSFPIVIPLFLEHEYHAILALGDFELPATHNGWLENRAKEKAKHALLGRVEQETIVHPQDLALYCQRCGENPTLTMLNAFAVAQCHGYK